MIVEYGELFVAEVKSVERDETCGGKTVKRMLISGDLDEFTRLYAINYTGLSSGAVSRLRFDGRGDAVIENVDAKKVWKRAYELLKEEKEKDLKEEKEKE